MVEAELVGGECPFWACIPSKTLLRPVEARGEAAHVAGLDRPALHWDEVARYRDYMVSDHDDTAKAEKLAEAGVEIVRGRGAAGRPRPGGGGRAHAARRPHRARHRHHERDPAHRRAWTASSTGPTARPRRSRPCPRARSCSAAARSGSSSRRCSRASAPARTLVEAEPRLLARETAPVGDLLAELLADDGIDVRLGAKASRVEAAGAGVRLHMTSGDAVEGERLVIAVGRQPRTEGLGLESVGIAVADDGTIPVDAHCRAGAGVWAVGDVTGVAPFTHVASYQARIAVDAILGRPREADYRAVPRVVFTDPEVAAVGETPEQARERGVDVGIAAGSLSDLDRTADLRARVAGRVRRGRRPRRRHRARRLGRRPPGLGVDPPDRPGDPGADAVGRPERVDGAVPVVRRGVAHGGARAVRVVAGPGVDERGVDVVVGEHGDSVPPAARAVKGFSMG